MFGVIRVDPSRSATIRVLHFFPAQRYNHADPTTEIGIMRGLTRFAIAITLVAAPAMAQKPARDTAALRKAVRAWRDANEVGVLDEFRRLLAIPNVASDTAHIRQNADTIVAMFARRG